MIDWLLLSLFIAAYIVNKRALPSLVAYSLCVLYQLTLFDSHSAIVNHLIYAVIFIPSAFFATMIKSFKQAFAICFYSAFHAFYAADWLMNPDTETLFSTIYNEAQIVIAISLIYFSIDRGQNGVDNKYPVNFSGFVDNIWHIQLRSKKSKRA